MEIERSEIFCVETFCKKCILEVQNETKKWELSVAHKATYKKMKLNLLIKYIIKCKTRMRFRIYKPRAFQIWVSFDFIFFLNKAQTQIKKRKMTKIPADSGTS